MRKLHALLINEFFKILAGKITRMVKNYRIEVLVQRNTANFIYIEYKIVEGVYLVVVEAKLFGCNFPRLMPPAVAEQHAADVEKQYFNRSSFQFYRITPIDFMITPIAQLNFSFLVFDGFQ